MRTAVIRSAVLGLCLLGVPGTAEAKTIEQSARPAERRETDKPMTDSTRRPGGNRLADATSPYLLQHKDNPVDWYAWGQEAFEAARRLDRPIFLSIGYSACHWCHVMEEESFEDPATAVLMNEHFVNIKVDREERPDLDDIYMTSVQMLTGSGGWPMSVWLTPDLKPFYGGTYFPKESHYGRPSFRQILTALGEAWKNDRASLVTQADKIHEAITQYLTGRRLPPGGAPPSRDLVARAVEEMSGNFDHVNGGFGGAPKFPPHRGLALMLARHRQTGDENLLRMATLTFDRMAAGGMYDQIGGGFHRYATDAAWQVPHFEKMLYDNALLSDAYLDAWETTGRDEYARIVREIGDWVLREMTGPQGGFHSTLDADSEGEEGLYYVWRPAQVIDLLGGEEGALVNEFYGITQQGNFEGGASIPHVDVPLPRLAERRKISVPELARRLAAARERMLAERNKRVRPHLDDKVLTAWNGLMIGALSRAGRALDERRYIEAAARAADFLMANARGEDGLMRVSWRAGRSRPESFLDDQAFLIQGLLALHEATGDPARLKQARALVAATDAAFWDPAEKGYYFALAGRSDLIVRAKSPTDSAIPSGNSAMAASLVRLRRLTGEAAYGDRAGDIFQAFSGAMGAIPGAFHNMLAALDLHLAGGGDPAVQRDVLTLQARAETAGAAPGGPARIEISLAILEGWHLNSAAPLQQHLIPTGVSIEPGDGFTLEGVDYPAGSKVTLPFSAEPLSVYTGRQTILVRLRVAPGTAARTATIRGAVTWQACNDKACLRPARSTFEVPLRIAPATER